MDTPTWSISCAWALAVPAATACSADLGYSNAHPCEYTEVRDVDTDDATDLGFSAVEAVSSASAETSGVAATDDPATAWNVQLTLEFTLAGTPSLIEFDPASDALCPTGRALRIPVEYQAAGTLGEWWVSSSRSGIALVATAAQLDAISSVAISDDLPQWQAEVDPAMEPIIRSELPASAPQDCELGFSLRPEPDSLLAGAWAEEITQGELAVACGGESYSTFTRWVADSITPLAQ